MMSNLSQTTRIGSGGLNGTFEAANTMQLGMYNYRENVDVRTSRFLHFKTNVPKGGGHMITIEALGYDYAAARPIHCSWSWYSYATDNLLYSIALQNMLPGLVPNAVYYSTDNYVCISAAAQDLYFIGVTLNSYTVQNSYGLGFAVAITASGTTTSSGNYF